MSSLNLQIVYTTGGTSWRSC